MEKTKHVKRLQLYGMTLRMKTGPRPPLRKRLLLKPRYPSLWLPRIVPTLTSEQKSASTIYYVFYIANSSTPGPGFSSSRPLSSPTV